MFTLTFFQIVLIAAMILMRLVMANAGEPRPLPMGVRVAKGDQIYLKSAEWRILVSMEAPSSDVDRHLSALKVRIQESQLPLNFKLAYSARLDGLVRRPVAFKWRQTDDFVLCVYMCAGTNDDDGVAA